MADGISMPNVNKISLSRIKELELVIDYFGKDAKREDLEGWATAVSLHALKCAGGKMSLQKIRTLTRAFNKTTATYGTLRCLILVALLGSPSIHTIAIRGVNYKTHIET